MCSVVRTAPLGWRSRGGGASHAPPCAPTPYRIASPFTSTTCQHRDATISAFTQHHPHMRDNVGNAEPDHPASGRHLAIALLMIDAGAIRRNTLLPQRRPPRPLILLCREWVCSLRPDAGCGLCVLLQVVFAWITGGMCAAGRPTSPRKPGDTKQTWNDPAACSSSSMATTVRDFQSDCLAAAAAHLDTAAGGQAAGLGRLLPLGWRHLGGCTHHIQLLHALQVAPDLVAPRLLVVVVLQQRTQSLAGRHAEAGERSV